MEEVDQVHVARLVAEVPLQQVEDVRLEQNAVVDRDRAHLRLFSEWE